jgi:hypothetical protein
MSRPGHSGISLRDYFAAAALQGYTASYLSHEGAPHTSADLAKNAYEDADAMIAERDK